MTDATAEGDAPPSGEADDAKASRRSLDTRRRTSEDRLLDVALDAFLDDGLTATIDSISAVAKISKRTIYAKYKDKRELFMAAVRRMLDNSAKTEFPLDVSAPLDQILYNLAWRSMVTGFTPAFIKIHRLSFRITEDFPELLEQLIAEPEVDFVQPLAAHLDELARRGEIRDTNTILVARSFLGSIFRELTVRVIQRTGKPEEAEADEWAQTLTDIYLHGLDWRPPGMRQRERRRTGAGMGPGR